MIISDLNYLESVSEATAVVGGCDDPTWSEWNSVTIDFTTSNTFTLDITSPSLSDGNYASAGAKGVADMGDYSGCHPLNSFTKADTIAVANYGGDSFSGSTSVAAISKYSNPK